jgi:hypothetical protein
MINVNCTCLGLSGCEFRETSLGFLPMAFSLPKVSSLNSYFEAHCKENYIYVFLFWELRGLSPNFNIHVIVSDLFIPRIGPHIGLQQNRLTDPGNI